MLGHICFCYEKHSRFCLQILFQVWLIFRIYIFFADVQTTISKKIVLISVDNPNPFVARLRKRCVKFYLKPSYELQCDKALFVLRYSCPRLSASNLRRITEIKEKQDKWKCFVNKLSVINPFPCKLKITILRDSCIQYFQYQLGEFAGTSDIFLNSICSGWSYVLVAHQIYPQFARLHELFL